MNGFAQPAAETARIVLCAKKNRGTIGPFLGAQWKGRWTRIYRGPTDALAAELGPIVRLHPGDRLPQIDGARLAVWLTELDQLEDALSRLGDWTTIVFEPSQTALLDGAHRERQTLIARRSISAGQVLKSADIAAVTGGAGLATGLQDQVLGKILRYAVAEGDDITFGVFE